jgi:hypothetical protein
VLTSPYHSLLTLRPNRSYAVTLFVIRNHTIALEQSIRTAAAGQSECNELLFFFISRFRLTPLSTFFSGLVENAYLSAASRTKATVPTVLTTHSAMLDRSHHQLLHQRLLLSTEGPPPIVFLSPTSIATPTHLADLDAAGMMMETTAHLSSQAVKHSQS